MKILLIANYGLQSSQSMPRFADMLYTSLAEAGSEVQILRPSIVLGRLRPSGAGLGKWLGYVDSLLLFRLALQSVAAEADVVHICDQANAVYVPWLKGKPHLVTCHDMLAISSALGEIPQNPTRFTGRTYQRWILRGLRKAQHTVCVSEKTRTELLRLAGISQARVSVVPNALNYPYHPMSEEEASHRLRQLGVPAGHPFLLHVGGNFWYKNRGGVLAIFSRLSETLGFESYGFVIAGEALTAEQRALISGKPLCARLHEILRPTNEDLRALYSSARALVFPSLYEGFGWPIVEAQACGCPVFTSNRPPMTQVGGDAAMYVDPDDPVASAAAIAEHLGEVQERIEAGMINAASFSKDALVRGYMEAYKMVMGGAKGGERSRS